MTLLPFLLAHPVMTAAMLGVTAGPFFAGWYLTSTAPQWFYIVAHRGF